MATDRRGEVPEGQKPYFEIPLFNWHKGFLTALYQRQYIDSAQRFADAPRLTPAHVEALDMFDSLANDPELNLFMEFKPGDVQLVHNHTMLHDRTGFVDWPEPERRRHLCVCGWRRPMPGRCPMCSLSATARSRSATAAASSCAAPSCTRRWRRSDAATHGWLTADAVVPK